MINIFTFCVDINRHTQNELLTFLSILVGSLDYHLKQIYKLIVYKNFCIPINHPNVEFRQYYDNEPDKMYQDPWLNLSLNKINVYKDLLDETGIDFLWLDLDTYVAHDISYINDLPSCFIEHGGMVDKPWKLFLNSEKYDVPTNRYIQGNVWKLNEQLYDSLGHTLKKIKSKDLLPCYDLQDLFNYYFFYELNGNLSSINILGFNSKVETINGLGIWDKERSVGPRAWSVAELFHDNNENLRTKLFPDKVIHFVSFVLAQTIHLLDDPNFISLFLIPDKNASNLKMQKLQKALIERPDDSELLNTYFNEAVAVNALVQARVFLKDLQKKNPHNHSIRKLSIALSLRQKDYPAALDAIETLLAFSTPDDSLIDSALAVRNYAGPRRIPEQTDRNGSLSLCMIVKNEQPFLGPCLNSIKSLVDEIIVVDTGSKDRSSDIAKVYGARIYDFQWCDDFAKARNAALEKAEGDWILILDADEIISPKDHSRIRQIVDKGLADPKAYTLQTRNYSNIANAIDWRANDGSYPLQETGIGWFPTDKVRLFPRLENIRFSYPVHELVDPSVHSAGLAIGKCPVPIHHYGHINEAKNLKKAKQYFNLGYAKLEQMGDDKAALRELAIQAGQLEKWREAIELWHRFLKLAPDYSEAYANIAGACWHTGQYEQGIEYSKKAIKSNPDQREGHYNLSVNLLMSGRPDEAAIILKKLLNRYPDYFAAQFMLGSALSLDNDYKQSREVFKTIEMKVTKQALTIAIKDLLQKLLSEGKTGSAHKIARTVGLEDMV